MWGEMERGALKRGDGAWVSADGDKQMKKPNAYLVLSGIEVVHVYQRNGVPILVVVQQDTNFVEQ
jgi:hypothetical protein